MLAQSLSDRMYSTVLPCGRLLNRSRRVQSALQNYFKKRNLDSERKNVLDKYLTFGGIRGGQKMFSGGIDPNTQDAGEIATMAAPYAVELDDDEEGWVVDFEGCLKGFL